MLFAIFTHYCAWHVRVIFRFEQTPNCPGLKEVAVSLFVLFLTVLRKLPPPPPPVPGTFTAT